MKESDVQTQIRLALSDICVLVRTNAGVAWQGDKQGNILINIRPVKLAFKGFPDLAGYRRSDGRAVYIECKRTRGGKRSPEQIKFIELALKSGCLAGFASTVEEARRIVEG